MIIKEIIITEEMDKIEKIFIEWGIDRDFCDADKWEIIQQIVKVFEK